jgi:hypothetical protein
MGAAQELEIDRVPRGVGDVIGTVTDEITRTLQLLGLAGAEHPGQSHVRLRTGG